MVGLRVDRYRRVIQFGENETVCAFIRTGGTARAIDTVGVCPFACQAVGEARSPLVVPVLRLTHANLDHSWGLQGGLPVLMC